MPASRKPVKKNSKLVIVEKIDQAKKIKQKAVPQKKKRKGKKREKMQVG